MIRFVKAITVRYIHMLAVVPNS